MRGIININKPEEFTSHDVVAILRRLLGEKRIGHTGTLDPMATGVLVVCVGNATRIIEYLDHHEKEYRCRLRFGLETDTYDVWGRTVRTSSRIPSGPEIETALAAFRGEIEQVPPMYAAIKVKGKKLYEYARAGQSVEVKSRKVRISRLVLEEYDKGEAQLLIRCSRGTYIRSLCHDLGEALGTCAAMSSLVRTASGSFRIEEAHPLQTLRQMPREDIARLLLPPDRPLTEMGEIRLQPVQANALIDGKKAAFSPWQLVKESCQDDKYRVYAEGIFIGVADRTEETALRADKIFCTEKL